MAELKYKVDTKSKLAKVAADLERVLNVRTPTPAASPAEGEGQPKKPPEGESPSQKTPQTPSD